MSNTRPQSHCVLQPKWLWHRPVNLGGRKMLSQDDTGVITKNKKKYITFNVKINVKLAVVTNKTVKKYNIQLTFIDSYRFVATGLDKLVSNLEINVRTLESFTRETNFYSLWDTKVYISISVWIAGRQSYHRKMHFTTSWTWKVSVIKIDTCVWKFCFRRLPWHLATDALLLTDVFETFPNMC